MKPIVRVFLLLLFVCLAVAASASGQWILPEQTAVIEEEAFLGVTADTVTFSDELRVIESRAFAEGSIGSVALPSGLTYIADNAFENTEIGSLTAVPGTYGYGWARAHGFISDSPAADFTWELTDEASAVITKYTGADAQVIVPAFLDGHPVSGIGANAFSANNAIQAVTLPDSVTSVGSQAFGNCAGLAFADIGAGIRRIGDYAFAGCPSLSTLPLPDGLEEIGRSAFESSGITEITLPDSIQTIGNYAWMNCTKLAVFRYPLNDTLTIGNDFIFKNCPSLKTVILPEGLTVLRGSFFKNLTGLEEVSLPSTLKTVGGGAFSGCTSLGSVSFPDGLEEIGDSAFESTAVTEALLPDSIRSIGNYAWMNCTKLAVFRYPLNNELTVGRDFIFRNCPALKTVILPEGLTVIRGSFFKNLTALEKVYLPSTLKTIEGGVFAGCISLGTVSFPDGLEEIGSGAFVSTAVTEALLPDSVRSVGNYAWRNCTQLAVFRYPAASEMTSGRDFIFQNCPSLKTVIIPEGAAIITDCFFRNLNALEEITLPSTLRTIGVSAFDSCTSLGTVSFPDGLETIGGGAFRYTAVTEAVLPDSVRSVGGDAWDNCGQLALFRYPMNNELTCGRSGLFDSCPALKTVIIPEGVTRLADSFFLSAVSLEEIRLPSTLKKIEANVFNACTDLAVLPLPDGLEEIGNSAFCGTAITEALLPDSVRFIGNDAWRNCAQLSVFRYPLNNDLVTGGGGGNFKERFTGCVSLKSITVPEGVTMIPEAFFRNAASLETVVLPSTLKVISGYAFFGCTSLASLPLPDGLEEIGACAFEGMPITEALLPDSVRLIGSFAWNNCTQLSVFRYPLNSDLSTGQTGPNYKERFTNCVSLKSIVVPEGVTKVPDGFFGYAASLEDVVIPYSVTEIGSFVFHACTGLDHVYLSENVTRIGNAAFAETPTAIWCEYASYALSYAQTNSISYYYLSPDGIVSPSGTLYRGDPFVIYGYARSSINITDLTARIYSGDTVIQSVSINPGETDHNLLASISRSLHFEDLPLGTYRYTLEASTELSQEFWVDNTFSIVPPPLRITLNNATLPYGLLDSPESFILGGTIRSNYPISTVLAEVINASDSVVTAASAAPGTLTYDISGLSGCMSGLGSGRYRLRITASANGETRMLAESAFSPNRSDVVITEDVIDRVIRFVNETDKNGHLFQTGYATEMLGNISWKDMLAMSYVSRKEWLPGLFYSGTLQEVIQGIPEGRNAYLIDLYESELASIIASMSPDAVALPTCDETRYFIHESVVNGAEIAPDLVNMGEIASLFDNSSAMDSPIRNLLGSMFGQYDDVVKKYKLAVVGLKVTSDYAAKVTEISTSYIQGLYVLRMLYNNINESDNINLREACMRLCSKYSDSTMNQLITGVELAMKTVLDLGGDELSGDLLKTIAGGELTPVAAAVKLSTLGLDIVNQVSGVTGECKARQTFIIQFDYYKMAVRNYMDCWAEIKQGSTDEATVRRFLCAFELAKETCLRTHQSGLDMEPLENIYINYELRETVERYMQTIRNTSVL